MKTADIRERCCQTLMALCETHVLNDITATDVIREAGIARQSFYNHFLDIDDLVCYAASRPLLSGEFPFSSPENTRKAAQDAQTNKAFFSQLATHSGQNNFRDAYNGWLKRYCYGTFIDPELSPAEKTVRKLEIDLFIVGSTDVLLEWFASQSQVPVEIILQVLWDAAPAFVRTRMSATPNVLPDYPQ